MLLALNVSGLAMAVQQSAWALTARVDNLLDREYVVSRRPFGARPGRPVAAQVGVEYVF